MTEFTQMLEKIFFMGYPKFLKLFATLTFLLPIPITAWEFIHTLGKLFTQKRHVYVSDMMISYLIVPVIVMIFGAVVNYLATRNEADSSK